MNNGIVVYYFAICGKYWSYLWNPYFTQTNRKVRGKAVMEMTAWNITAVITAFLTAFAVLKMVVDLKKEKAKKG